MTQTYGHPGHSEVNPVKLKSESTGKHVEAALVSSNLKGKRAKNPKGRSLKNFSAVLFKKLSFKDLDKHKAIEKLLSGYKGKGLKSGTSHRLKKSKKAELTMKASLKGAGQKENGLKMANPTTTHVPRGKSSQDKLLSPKPAVLLEDGMEPVSLKPDSLRSEGLLTDTGKAVDQEQNHAHNFPSEQNLKPKIIIVDLRKKPVKPAPAAPHQGIQSNIDAKVQSILQSDEKELPVIFKTMEQGGERLKGGNTTAPGADLQESSSARTQEMLKAFQEKMIPEMVQRTGIILKDGGKGEIRLVLKPESLGNVRIRIKISENIVEGRIVVENNTVKRLFEASLENLRNALRQEGFQTASLGVSVGNDRDQTGENKGFYRSKTQAIEEFEKALPVIHEYLNDQLMVNLVV